MNRIKVYTKDMCQACKMTKRVLTEAGVSFDEVFVDVRTDTETVEMLRLAGFRSFPVVMLDEDFDTAISGFHPPRLKAFIETVKEEA
ncbi:thioredoxin domain protein [Enterococcus phage PEF9]